MAKEKAKPTDGYGAYEMKKISSAIRLVWQRCRARRLALKKMEHLVDGESYYECENCGKIVPKVKVDHIIPVGTLRDGFIERLFCPSTGLQCLCGSCHKVKTKLENAARKLK